MVNISNEDVIVPEHYQKNGLDLIDIWKLKYSPEEFRVIMKAQIDRYVTRYEKKNGIQDLDKATEYIRRLKEWEVENE